MRAAVHLEPIFQRGGYQFPQVNVSIGFFSNRAKGRRLGQCWVSKASEDAINQIFIAPNQSHPAELLNTLIHELVHAVDDCKSHGEGFKKMATDLGLQGPMRSAGAGLHLKQDLIRISQALGHFPYARLLITRSASRAGIKRPWGKCAKCGYELVMMKRFLQYGPPIFPKDREGMVQIGEWEEI